MKILYITENSNYDYLRDSIFIGLVKNGHEVTDSKYLWMMGPLTEEQAAPTFCKGFTYGNVLDAERANIDRSNIEEKIRAHFYDLVVYGSFRRCFDYSDAVFDTYKRGEIIVLDGEDEQVVDNDLGLKCVYFKRELCSEFNNCLPISFSIPSQKLCYDDTYKSKFEAFITPFDKRTYIYKDEASYYKDYRESLFAHTCKKAGWDCLRHYEIVANKCLPYFTGYEGKPIYTMTNWPTDLQMEANHLFRVWNDRSDYYYDRIYKLIDQFFYYTINNLTCEKVAENMLRRI